MNISYWLTITTLLLISGIVFTDKCSVKNALILYSLRLKIPVLDLSKYE